MEVQVMHMMMYQALDQWDPFRCGEGNYDTEIADAIQAVHDFDSPDKLARKIQGIYEFSFESIIPLEQCKKMAETLLVIKNSGSCTI
ncbi:YugE family protein [Bacillus infantis]|uniref:DUF1871 family protein n=1 Tax=Bacillus infantis TaxID=324767 RepID=A0A5D4QWM9_9BACI|nr:YugE family protein [Bacillus infantis]TYS42274.1 DUF1871 family protein [Bacillus infantis]